ncbi:MAG TPA: cation-translocating P-type ATPase [Candidatus Acidoferrales bacterium]|nr:cation-translocating P-type ATPase [Candidatus Acidoferrales bacterium]
MPKNSDQHTEEESCSVCATDIFAEKEPLWKQREVLTIAIAGSVLGIGVYVDFMLLQHMVAQGLYLIAALVAGYRIITKGIQSLARRRLDMNFLMVIAATGAFAIGHGEEGASILLLFSIAEFLEDYAGERARESVGALIKLAPETAIVIRDGKEKIVHAHEVAVGELVVVKPGDKIPVDGVVVRGTSSVNQAPITGESVLVTKTRGDEVFAGTINGEGYLQVRAIKRSDETILSKIVQLVDEAQREKSPTEAFIDRFARYYTPTVIGLAALVVVIPPLLLGLPFNEWFYKGLVLLVVSCPCAMAISTPVSMVSGLTSAAKNGVLIKGGSNIEKMQTINAMVFDKTGTLTEGKPEVVDIISMNEVPEQELLQIAASLESLSSHPVADAIVTCAAEQNIALMQVSEFKSLAGKGLIGTVDGRTYSIGNRSFFAGLIIDVPEQIERLENEGKTIVLVGVDSRIVGVLGLMDKTRDMSVDTIKALREKRIRTVMLTGDNERAARAIANKLTIDEYYANLLPEDKVAQIESLLKKYEYVAMVGDGVNDAPALAKAQVGIAMGAIGSDVAIETADIALMRDDLSKINYLIDLSKKTMSIVKQNISASILIKASFAVLTFPGIITLWLAVAVGDMGLSLAVILNALRIGRKILARRR